MATMAADVYRLRRGRMDVITTTLWLTVGITFYGGDFVGQTMACGEVYTTTTEPWAAVPIEWMLSGAVECGDMVYATLASGYTIEVPIKDTGCLLHYGAWDTGRPFALDLPRLHFPFDGDRWITGTGQVKVWRQRLNRWWDPPPLTAWATRWCDGPLTVRRVVRYNHVPR